MSKAYCVVNAIAGLDISSGNATSPTCIRIKWKRFLSFQMLELAWMIWGECLGDSNRNSPILRHLFKSASGLSEVDITSMIEHNPAAGGTGLESGATDQTL